MSILARIRANGGDVTRKGYEFRFRPGRLNRSQQDWVMSHIDEVKREVWPLFDEWEERAAIMEYDGGFARSVAERAAFDLLEGRNVDAS